MALFLSSQCGEVVTVEQLLGEPEPDPAAIAQTRIAAAEKDLEKRLAARRK